LTGINVYWNADIGTLTLELDMGKLVTASQFANPDAAYVALVEARRGLSDAAAAALDARLLLILANHIGDLDVVREAIELAGDTSGDGAR